VKAGVLTIGYAEVGPANGAALGADTIALIFAAAVLDLLEDP